MKLNKFKKNSYLNITILFKNVERDIIKMSKIRKIFTSIRTKLFLSLCIIVSSIILFLIILNNFVLESFYVYSKETNLKNVYYQINEYYNSSYSQNNIDRELEKIAVKNNFDILIKSKDNQSIYTSNKDFYSSIRQMLILSSKNIQEENIINKKEEYTISELNDTNTNIKYIMLTATLDNNYQLYIRMPMASIQESVKISNRFLYTIAIFIVIIGGFVVSIVSRRFSKPIEELDNIAKNMANLNFSQKYKISDANDEIDNLGKSINLMSQKLENTIEQLRNTNIELEKDIEEKSQIDEMRKSFISDVSHELKTPIALIQGYSEGLIENINSDEESRKYYAEVILDEATKMDKLVKQLLELMKLEYGKKDFNNKEFDIIELEHEILRKSQVMVEKENIEVEMEESESIKVFADDFYIDQVFTNYITNAIKYSTEINGKKKIKIKNEVDYSKNKVKVTVFNTCESISDEDISRMWNRFYKLDESRNRDKGGNGIGLSLVKAIMNNYGNDYGAKNVAGGIEFYFEVDLFKD